MKIALGTLKDKGEDLVAFLEPRVGTKPSLSGDTVEIDDEGIREGVKPRHVKTYIKRFLYMNGVRKNYRVFVAGKELTVQEIEVSEEEEEEAKPEEKKKEEKEEPQEQSEDQGEEKEEGKEEEAAKDEPEPAEEKPEEKAADEEPDESEPEKPKKAAKKPRAPKKKKTDEESGSA